MLPFPSKQFVSDLMLGSDEEDVIDCYQYHRKWRVQKKHWVHPYIRDNVNSRLFVSPKELSQIDRQFIGHIVHLCIFN